MDIGGAIFKGIMSAAWLGVSHMPFMIWVVLFFGVILFGVLMRYFTNIKVDAALVAVFVIGNSILVWRAHWIDQGYNEALDKVKAAEAQVAGYKKTNGLIEACYAKNFSASWLWDRTQGKCLPASGAIGGN
jgi:hypothetical protein